MTTPTKRKVVQIDTQYSPLGKYQAHSELYITALCNDGTIWERCTRAGVIGEWRRLPDIPQPEDDDA